MSTTDTALQVSRYVALDVHRSYLMVGAVDQHQQVVLTPRRFGFESFTAWAATHLSKSDAVVLEATANAWLLYDQLEPMVASVTVAHPLAVKLISAARVKTDARDTIKLARGLSANLIPSVWVPPLAVRELRALVTHRKRLVKQRTQTRNRLYGVLQRHSLLPPEGKAKARENAQLVARLAAFCFRAAAGSARSRLVRSTQSVDRRGGDPIGAAEYQRALEQAGTAPALVAWLGDAFGYDHPGCHWADQPFSLS